MGAIEGNRFTADVLQARDVALPLEEPSDFDPLLERAANARLVLIGEASHGTHDYYDLRAKLTRRLIAECGFSIAAFEADQSACEPIDRCVRLMDGASEDPEAVLSKQRQWPSWTLANNENLNFLRWLRGHNQESRAIS